MKPHGNFKAVTIPLRRLNRALYTSSTFPPFPPSINSSIPSSSHYLPYDAQPSSSSSRPTSTLLPTTPGPAPQNPKAPSGQTAHPSLALSPIPPFNSGPVRSPTSASLPAFAFYPPLISPLFFPHVAASSAEQPAVSAYRFESGAYGIPKRGAGGAGKNNDGPGLELDLAVQVGEDSYFLRPVSNDIFISISIDPISLRPIY